MLDYKELKEIDLKMHLLSGSNIKVDNLIVKPYTLKEIKNYGYLRYMETLQWILLSIDDFISSINEDSKKDILLKNMENLKTFDFYYKFGGKEIQNRLIEALKMIFRTDDIKVLAEGIIAIDFEKDKILYKEDNKYRINEDVIDFVGDENLAILHRDNFDDLVKVIKLQNCLEKPKEIASNPVDEETRKLIEQMEQNRRKVEEKKRAKEMAEKGDDSKVDISDIISSVSSKSNSVNKLNIWEFTLYQLYDEYSRLELIDNYYVSIKAMMAGAEKVELRHWSSKI